MHQYIVPLIAFLATSIVFTLTPGLDTVMILRTAAGDGRKMGMGAVCGIAIGLGIWGLAAALGLTALLEASKTAFFLLKCAGAVYLTWLGLHSLIRPRTSFATEIKKVSPRVSKIKTGPFGIGIRRGLMTDLLNPKAGIFIMTFFPQFIPPHTNVALFTLIMTAIQMILAFLWLSLLVILTVPLGGILKKPAVVKCLDRLSGIVFIGFGIKIFMTRNPI
ncbi:LysE family transporter [Aristophania vespae]|uniref:LysE family transporter n=1 Tax=Aristophania vespae TaxID=2697033 RepID=A0A6P1NA52_9PROT|nr:LysE family translocator [Aristophania vespae]QHI95286.1 LysE family transporter [Aristophania vespae]UMM64541.1 Leucine efflux protein [Aristophania vespae]